ncbi:NifX-associated nitrogen fixation protein [Nodosilinea nodulosa]|uniref:NifX-associated nitrogen fixation protein n=1 Tax=Nodosilinea nodulosa TaxID=416001 RepID=UPI0002DFF66B|nr:NifX-associated nitrogen fixation protein [Nodosilinea nodulosa]
MSPAQAAPALQNTFENALIIDNAPFLKAIVQQIRANDPYGTYRNWADELLLKPYVLSKAQKREISVDGDVDPITQSRIMAFYRAIAYRIEEESGLLSQVVIDLSHEGFGWALIFSGRLLLVSKTLRDAQRFGFASLEKLNEDGEKLVQKGIELAQRFPDVADV